MSKSEYRTVTLRDGRALAYAEFGSPAGQPIIYCHGVPSSRVEADLIVDDTTAAALGVRVIVPDRPGIGHSQYQPDRRIVDWPNDVLDLAGALGLNTFAVLGSSGGAPYAIACGALIPTRVRVIGVLGGVAPPNAPGVMASMSGPLRVMFRLARFAPAVLRGLFRLNLRTFEEACRQGPRGPVTDITLIAGPWGFDLATVNVPVLLWHGERDRNVPVAGGRYLAGALPTCRATFYANDAHLSVPLNHQKEIFGALAAALAAA